MKTNLIKRTYRISEDNEKKVKKVARKEYVSESEVIRKAIDNIGHKLTSKE